MKIPYLADKRELKCSLDSYLIWQLLAIATTKGAGRETLDKTMPKHK